MRTDIQVLVVGGSGYIGKMTSLFLKNQGVEVHGIGRNLFQDANRWGFSSWHNLNDCAPWSERSKLDSLRPTLVLFAAGLGSVSGFERDSTANITNEIALLARAIEYCNSRSIQPLLVYLSSAAVYGNSPMARNESEVLALRDQESSYSFCKLFCEEFLQHQKHRLGLKYVALRLGTIYGPNMTKQLVFDLFNKMSSLENQISLLGSATQSRDFVFVKDLAAFINFLIWRNPGTYTGPSVINFGTGCSVPVSEVVRLVANRLSFSGNVLYENIRNPINPDHLNLDISKLIQLGYSCDTNMELGIDLCFQSNYSLD